MSASRAVFVRVTVAGCIGAAFIMVAAWFSLVRLGRPPQGSSIRCITPSEVSSDSPLLLAWEGGGPPFRVALESRAGERLWESEVLHQPLVEVPRAVVARLPGEPLSWRVEGIDRRGHAFRATPCPLSLIAVR